MAKHPGLENQCLVISFLGSHSTHVSRVVFFVPAGSELREEVTCMLDDDNTNDELERCLRLGADYVQLYLKALKPGKQHAHRFHRCG